MTDTAHNKGHNLPSSDVTLTCSTHQGRGEYVVTGRWFWKRRTLTAIVCACGARIEAT